MLERLPPADARRKATRSRRARVVEALLNPCNALTTFAVAIFSTYCVVPALVYFLVLPDSQFLRLTIITLIGTTFMLVGRYLPIFDYRFTPAAPRFVLGWRFFVGMTTVVFISFIVVTIATAGSIPLLSALQGADPDTLSQERGEFLKGRRGAWLALLYLSTFLLNTIVPYSAVVLYMMKHRLRHLFALLVFAFSISFLQKALFLNLVLPLLAYFAMAGRLRGSRALIGFAASVLILILSTYLSLGTAQPGLATDFNMAEFMTAQYRSDSPLRYFIWRAFAVPVFTATDTLTVHEFTFGGRPLLGATSTLLSFLFGFERINIERYVFEYQFGGWNDYANANAVFLVDAYVNFSWPGVIVYGLLVGQVFRWFCLSKDVAFRSLWPLFAFILFSAPLIGMLLSNGWLAVLFFALFMRLRQPRGALAFQPQGPAMAPAPFGGPTTRFTPGSR